MDLIIALQQNVTFFYITVGIISLLIGSFLNAAIYRIPIMLENSWREDCEHLFEKEQSAPSPEKQPFNLFVPRSQCPSCGHVITALENIPVLSYLFLRGKCNSCKTHISIQYPLIELFTVCLSLLAAWKFGATVQTITILFFIWTLITLSLIDAKTMLLPDNLTLPLLWLGIIVNYFGIFTDLGSSVLGAIFGYLTLWSIFHLFRLLTGKEGMGYGDFKLLAALGAWGRMANSAFHYFRLLSSRCSLWYITHDNQTLQRQPPSSFWPLASTGRVPRPDLAQRTTYADEAILSDWIIK